MFQKPVWQLSCAEFCDLLKFATAASGNEDEKDSGPSTPRYAHGIHELGGLIGCCDTTVYYLKKTGILDPAIVSQIGRRIIFDVEKARRLAAEYQKCERERRRQQRIGVTNDEA